ncbi:hypothetical protein MMC30_004808 [Trapelia coarctata]|nr:hypothetical protein [Trapelia coarctata]
MWAVRALLLLFSYLYLAPTVSAKLGEIKCYHEGAQLHSAADKTRATLACRAAINRVLPGSGYHLLSGHDPFNRDFSSQDCNIHVEGLHIEGKEDTYHIAHPANIGKGVFMLWRELARAVVQECLSVGLDGGLGLSRIEINKTRYYFVVVVRPKAQ